MRTKSAQVDAVIANPHHSGRAYVTVYSSAGVAGPTWGTEAGSGPLSPVLGVEVSQDIDSPRTASVRLQRQQGRYSLAPLVSSNNPLFISEAPVAIGRRIVIEAELLPPGISNVPAGLKLQVFDGFIDEVQWPGDEMELVCTDKSARPRDTFIERERVYCACQGVYATKGAYQWADDLPPLAVGDLVLPSAPNGHFYRVTAATSAQNTLEPPWPTGSGATVGSGGVTFTESGTQDDTGTAIETLIGQLLADNGLGSFATLNCPVSPSWNVRPYAQQRESVLDALQAVARQLGWWLRFEWDGSKFELTLAEPARTSSTVHKTLEVTDEVECDELAVDVWSIRNVVQVIFSDSADRDAKGVARRKVLSVSDSASITKYGRRWCELAEASSSSIDTAAEATRLANAVLADLKEPTAGLGISFAVDPYLELGDRLTVKADGLRFSADQTLAIESLSHVFTDEGASTSVTLRGAPAAARDGWLEQEQRTGSRPLLTSSPDQLHVVTNSAIAGVGAQLTAQYRADGGEVQYDLHVSRTDGFTPTADTNRGASREARGLPGRTYYARLQPYTWERGRKLLGSPTPQQTVEAGYVEAAHISGRAVTGGPRNGDFEDLLDVDGNDFTPLAPPDHWTMDAGTWGASDDAFAGTTTAHGRHVALRQTGTNARLESSIFRISTGARMASLIAAVRPQGTLSSGRDLQFHVDFYSDAEGANSVGDADVACPYNFVAANTWAQYLVSLPVPAGAEYARVQFYKVATSSAYGWDVGSVELHVQPDVASEAWTGVSFLNSFSDYNTATYQACAYKRTAAGRVELRGLAKRASAALNTAIFTLPVGYRPSKTTNFVILADARAAHLEVRTNGDVVVFTADSANWFAYFSLAQVSFDTEA